MSTVFYIFLGGGLGAIARFGLSSGVDKIIDHEKLRNFPFGILTCNLIGCFLIGCAFGLFGNKHHLHPLLVTGFLGGFTTFSTFGKDSHQLLSSGFSSAALANILLSVLGGLASVWLGLRLTTTH